MSKIIRHIAICGYPETGKSEVQRILAELYRVQPIDDGRVLRDSIMRMLGVSNWHVTSQEGKRSTVTICGNEIEIRKALGDLGKWMEDYFGAGVLPEIAMRDANHWTRIEDVSGRSLPIFSYGSVRKMQAHAYKAVAPDNTIVIEVTRPGVTWNDNAFDDYDTQPIDITIANDGTLDDLREKVKRQVGDLIENSLKAYDVVH